MVHSSAEGLAVIRAQRPEIAFLDLHMPGLSGDDLARQLREDLGSNSLYLVALSGYGLDSRKKTDGFDRHLLKPLSVEAVVALLNSLTVDDDSAKPTRNRRSIRHSGISAPARGG